MLEYELGTSVLAYISKNNKDIVNYNIINNK